MGVFVCDSEWRQSLEAPLHRHSLVTKEIHRPSPLSHQLEIPHSPIGDTPPDNAIRSHRPPRTPDSWARLNQSLMRLEIPPVSFSASPTNSCFYFDCSLDVSALHLTSSSPSPRIDAAVQGWPMTPLYYAIICDRQATHRTRRPPQRHQLIQMNPSPRRGPHAHLPRGAQAPWA